MTKNHPDISCHCLPSDMEEEHTRDHCPADMQPLSRTCCQGRVKVCRLSGDRKACARMASLGLLPGRELELVCPRRGSGGQCMIRIDGGTLSLDSALAENILVTRAVTT